MTRYALRSLTLPGGTVWPLPDGTVVELEYLGEPEPGPEPQPVGPHAHFESLLPHAVASYSLREGVDYTEFANGRGDGGTFSYDPEQDAAKITIPPGRPSIPTSDYLRLPFPRVSIEDEGAELSVQWEARWSSVFADPDALDGIYNHKAFRFDDTILAGDDRRIELQTRFGEWDAKGGLLPTIRSYVGPIGGTGNANPLEGRLTSGDVDWQPGGDTSAPKDARPHQPGGTAYLVPLETWVRFTASLTYASGEQRLRLWIADEDRDPVLVIADPEDSSKGFLCGGGEKAAVNQFCVLFNSSQTRDAGEPLVAWVRNVVVYRDKTVPLGGRPGKEPRK